MNYKKLNKKLNHNKMEQARSIKIIQQIHKLVNSLFFNNYTGIKPVNLKIINAFIQDAHILPNIILKDERIFEQDRELLKDYYEKPDSLPYIEERVQRQSYFSKQPIFFMHKIDRIMTDYRITKFIYYKNRSNKFVVKRKQMTESKNKILSGLSQNNFFESTNNQRNKKSKLNFTAQKTLKHIIERCGIKAIEQQIKQQKNINIECQERSKFKNQNNYGLEQLKIEAQKKKKGKLKSNKLKNQKDSQKSRSTGKNKTKLEKDLQFQPKKIKHHQRTKSCEQKFLSSQKTHKRSGSTNTLNNYKLSG